MAKMLSIGAVENVQSGSCASDPPGVNPKVVCTPGATEREKKNQIEKATTRKRIPSTRCLVCEVYAEVLVMVISEVAIC
jgi:hypothetical protein